MFESLNTFKIRVYEKGGKILTLDNCTLTYNQISQSYIMRVVGQPIIYVVNANEVTYLEIITKENN